MADEKKVEVIFVANVSNLLSGMQQAATAVQAQTAGMQTAFTGLTGAFGKVTAAFGILGGVLAGGSAFGSAVSATKAWNGEVMKLAATLGITTQEASVLNMALGDIYSSSDQYLQVAGMMTKQINSGAEGFKKLGIEVKDSGGNLKPVNVLMNEAFEKIRGMKQGVDQQTAGMAVFGKAWRDAAPMMKLNAQVMEEARQKAEKLNMIVGGDAVEAQKKYKAAMNDFDDVMVALKVAVGKELMPLLAELATFFAEVGPGAVEVISVSIKGLVTGFYTLKFAISAVAQVVGATIFGTLDAIMAVENARKAFMAGNFKEAVAHAKSASEVYRQNWSAAAEGIKQDFKQLGEKLGSIWDKPAAGAGTKVGKGGADTFDPEKGKDKDRMGEWELALRTQQEALSRAAFEEGKYWERNLDGEIKFWQEKLALTAAGSKERQTVARRIADLEIQQQKETLDARKAALDTAIGDERLSLQRKLEMAQQEVGMYQVGTKGYEEARRKVLQVEEEIRQQAEALRMTAAEQTRDQALLAVEFEEEALKTRAALGLASYEEQLAAQRTFLEKRKEAERAFLEEELASAEMTVERRAQINARLLALSGKFQLDEQKLRDDAKLKVQEDAEARFAPITEAWNRSLAGMLNGTMRFSDGLRGIWQGFGKVLDQVIMEMINKWIAAELKKLAITAAAKIKELVLHQSTAAATIATTTATATTQVTAAGAVAGANAAASAAQTPFIGWAIAIPAGLAVLAAVLALKGRIGSAAGGWDLPGGINPVAQLHANEMVLPAHLADRIRNITEPAAQQSAPPSLSFQITALDAKSVERALRDNSSALGQAVRDYARNFGGK